MGRKSSQTGKHGQKPPPSSYNLAMCFLGSVAIIGTLGVVLQSSPSDALIAITSSAVGGLGGIFSSRI